MVIRYGAKACGRVLADAEDGVLRLPPAANDICNPARPQSSPWLASVTRVTPSPRRAVTAEAGAEKTCCLGWGSGHVPSVSAVSRLTIDRLTPARSARPPGRGRWPGHRPAGCRACCPRGSSRRHRRQGHRLPVALPLGVEASPGSRRPDGGARRPAAGARAGRRPRAMTTGSQPPSPVRRASSPRPHRPAARTRREVATGPDGPGGPGSPGDDRGSAARGGSASARVSSRVSVMGDGHRISVPIGGWSAVTAAAWMPVRWRPCPRSVG